MKKFLFCLAFGFWVIATGAEIFFTWHRGVSPPPEPELLRRAFNIESNADLSFVSYQDFAAHYLFVGEFWRGSSKRPYTEEGQKQMTTAWLGGEPLGGLAFAYSPMLFLLFAPLLPLGVEKAYLLYGAVVLILLCVLVLKWARPLLGSNRNAWFFFFVAGCGISWLSMIKHGQNTVFTVVALVWIWKSVWDGKAGVWRRGGGWNEWVAGLVMGALTTKPNMAVMVGALVVAAGWWRAVGMAASLVVMACVTTTVHLGGIQWATDYVHLLGHYNRQEIGPFLASSLDLVINTNLLSAFGQLTPIPEAILARISSLLWLLGLLVYGWSVLRRPRCEVPFWFGLNLLWFLLVSPNLIVLEDLQLLVLPLVAGGAFAGRSWWVAVALAFVAVNGNQGHGLWSHTALAEWPVPFFAKVALLVWWISLRRVIFATTPRSESEGGRSNAGSAL